MPESSTLSDASPHKKFRLVGGALCLDFCNSVGGKRGVVARECLHTYDDFISWCEQAALLDGSQAAVLRRRGIIEPGLGHEVLGRARELREAIYRIFLASSERTAPASADLAILNSELARSMCRLRIRASPGELQFGWEWTKEALELDQPLGPIAYSAATLLASETAATHVRQCRGDNCGWLFLDASKNHSRCWCDMRDCGNLAKVRRHRQKHRSSV